MAHAAIVGAGPGGLAAAMLLTKAGIRVSVHERLDRLGGRSGTLLAPGPPGAAPFRFDIGPTFFLYPRVLQDIFTACGRSLAAEVDLIRLDPQYRLMFGDGAEIHATADPQKMAAEIARLSPQDALALPRFMAENRAKLNAFRPVLESAFNGIRDYVKPSMLKSLPLLRPMHSVDDDLMRHFSDPRVRLAFSFQSKYLGMSPFRCPSLFTILSFMEYEFGVWHPRGGTGAVIEAMARVAREMGVEIHLNDPVESIMMEGRRAVGLRTRQGETPADVVVVNADFAHAIRRLVPDKLRRRWSDQKIEQKKFSCSTFMLYLGIEGTLPDLPHHTIYLSTEYRQNIAEIEARQHPPSDPSFYVQNAAVTDPSVAPAGHSTLYVLVPVGHNIDGGIDWVQEMPRYRQLALDRLALIGIPNIEKRIRFEKIMTPPDWEHDMAIHRGATFNLAHTFSQMLHLRPRNRFEDLQNVYLVGGGTHPGSGLPVIFEGARITSRLIAEDLGLDAHWSTASAMGQDHYEPAFKEAT